ncbi:MAG: cytochrome b [Pseudomonadota bacterium]
MIFNTKTGWGLPARVLHWAMAVLILFMLGLGAYMANFVDDIYQQFELFQLHKSWGFVAFALAVLRILWRLINPAPAMPEGMSRPERVFAKAGHLALYVLIVVMPLSGWLMSSASTLQDTYGIKNMVFGLFELPDPFVPGGEDLEKLFATIHFLSAIAMTGLIVLHAAAALRHQLVQRDGLLRRMIVGK